MEQGAEQTFLTVQVEARNNLSESVCPQLIQEPNILDVSFATPVILYTVIVYTKEGGRDGIKIYLHPPSST